MTYSLSADLFTQMDSYVFTDILLPFTNSQFPNLRIAIDKKEAILGRYNEHTPDKFKDSLSFWRALMSNHVETSFMVLEIDLQETPQEEYCLKVASSIKGERTLIVNSTDNVSFKLDGHNNVEYEGELIPVIGKNCAKQNLFLDISGSRVTYNYNTTINVNKSHDVNINNNTNNG